jgi:hypothetical protein
MIISIYHNEIEKGRQSHLKKVVIDKAQPIFSGDKGETTWRSTDSSFRTSRAGSGTCREELYNKTLPKDFVFLCHYCHHFRSPLRQRAEPVTEEVAVVVLLSPQPARGGSTSRENRRACFRGTSYHKKRSHGTFCYMPRVTSLQVPYNRITDTVESVI